MRGKDYPNTFGHERAIEFGKVPPQALDLEELVLGSVMLEKNALDKIVEFIRPEIFYKEIHQIIFRSIMELYRERKPIDILTVTDKLRRKKELDMIGGPVYITSLTNRVASTANLEFHASVLMQKFMQREVIRISSEAMNQAYEDTKDSLALLDETEKQFTSIRNFALVGGGLKHIAKIGVRAYDELKAREQMAKDGKCTGVVTPITELTRTTRGWQPADLITIAGRPGMGKTALLIASAKAAAKDGVPVCLYELEMQDTSLYNRLILSECGLSSFHFMSGNMNELDWQQFNEAAYRLSNLPIYVDDNPVVDMRYIHQHSKMMKKKGQCGLIGIDYLQLADVGDISKRQNRERDIADASRAAKIMAKDLGVPVLLLSQLSRAVESRGGDKKPILSDLRESGAIEQDSDIVIFAYRPIKYGIKEDNQGRSLENVGFLLIEKHRNGACRQIPFTHNQAMTKIADYDEYNHHTFEEPPEEPAPF